MALNDFHSGIWAHKKGASTGLWQRRHYCIDFRTHHLVEAVSLDAQECYGAFLDMNHVNLITIKGRIVTFFPHMAPKIILRFSNAYTAKLWKDALQKLTIGHTAHMESDNDDDDDGTSDGRGAFTAAIEAPRPRKNTRTAPPPAVPAAPEAPAGTAASTTGAASLIQYFDSRAPKPHVAQTRGMPRDAIPTRFLVGCNMDPREAERRWHATHEWRRNMKIDDLLSCRFFLDLEDPVNGLAYLKSLYFHGFHGRSPNGSPVYYDRISVSNFQTLLDATPANRSLGSSRQRYTPASPGFRNIVRYYVFITEYQWEYLAPRDPGGRGVTVYDLQDVTFRSLFGNGFKMVTEVTSYFQQHYPERGERIFLLNAPVFFSTIWRLIKPILDPRTVAKMSISSKDRSDLLNYLGPKNVPAIYGGSDPIPFGEAPEETQFRDYVDAKVRELLAAEQQRQQQQKLQQEGADLKEQDQGDSSSTGSSLGGGPPLAALPGMTQGKRGGAPVEAATSSSSPLPSPLPSQTRRKGANRRAAPRAPRRGGRGDDNLRRKVLCFVLTLLLVLCGRALQGHFDEQLRYVGVETTPLELLAELRAKVAIAVSSL